MKCLVTLLPPDPFPLTPKHTFLEYTWTNSDKYHLSYTKAAPLSSWMRRVIYPCKHRFTPSTECDLLYLKQHKVILACTHWMCVHYFLHRDINDRLCDCDHIAVPVNVKFDFWLFHVTCSQAVFPAERTPTYRVAPDKSDTWQLSLNQRKVAIQAHEKYVVGMNQHKNFYSV